MATLPPINQCPIAEVNRSAWDVIVVGAGPGGGAAATFLAENGLAVLLVDRTKFPREKVCGDGLVPESMTALDRIGLADVIRSYGTTFPAYTLVSPSGSPVTLKSSLTVLQREVLDSAISCKAVCNGATFAQADFTGVTETASGDLDCSLGERQFRCKVLIVAPGADLTCLRGLGFAPQSAKPQGVAMRRYYRAAKGPSQPYFFLRDDFLPGYAWIFPLGNNHYNVGCGRFLREKKTFRTSLVSAFESFLREDPVASALVDNAEDITPLRGASLRCGMRDLRHAHSGRILLAGEAIGTTIPGWGEGISKAMETGILAAEVALDSVKSGDFSRLAEYPRRLVSEVRPDVERHTRVTWFFERAWTANLLVSLARSVPSRWL